MTSRTRRIVALSLAGLLVVAMVTADVVTLTRSKSNFDTTNQVLTQAAKDIRRDKEAASTTTTKVRPTVTTTTG